MSTYIGNTSFRTVEVNEFEDSEGVDTVSIVRKGKYTDEDTEKAAWTRGRVGTSLGYPNMYLQTKRVSSGRSNYSTITLEFAGYLSSSLSNPISIDDTISQQSTTLITDENDSSGSPVNVQVKFNSQTTTTRWIYRGTSAPTAPQYPAVVPSEVSTNSIFDPFPADYPGTLLKQVTGRMMAFDRSELATGVWAVTEVWQIRIEPESE